MICPDDDEGLALARTERYGPYTKFAQSADSLQAFYDITSHLITAWYLHALRCWTPAQSGDYARLLTTSVRKRLFASSQLSRLVYALGYIHVSAEVLARRLRQNCGDRIRTLKLSTLSKTADGLLLSISA
jgi:hypothetical protein